MHVVVVVLVLVLVPVVVHTPGCSVVVYTRLLVVPSAPFLVHSVIRKSVNQVGSS